jgi:hypothetical protein
MAVPDILWKHDNPATNLEQEIIYSKAKENSEKVPIVLVIQQEICVWE